MATKIRNRAEAKDESFFHATKPIPSLSGYRIDRVGNLYSCIVMGSRGPMSVGPKWRLLRTQLVDGYLRASVRSPNGKPCGKLISRLVLEAWVGPCPHRHECCHNDGNKMNNSVDNLRWDTTKENWRDRFKHGVGSRLTKDQIMEMRRLRADGLTHEKIGAMFGISRRHAARVITGERCSLFGDKPEGEANGAN